jgi:hypothetical protein
VSKGIWSCYEGPNPLGPGFNLFRNHDDFASSSSLPCLDFLIKFQVEANLDFKKKHVQVTFIHLTHLLANERFGMVFECFQDLIDPKDLTNNFSHLFLVCSYVVVGRIFKSITKAFGVIRMLVLAKPSCGIQPIVVGKVFY